MHFEIYMQNIKHVSETDIIIKQYFQRLTFKKQKHFFYYFTISQIVFKLFLKCFENVFNFFKTVLSQ